MDACDDQGWMALLEGGGGFGRHAFCPTEKEYRNPHCVAQTLDEFDTSDAFADRRTGTAHRPGNADRVRDDKLGLVDRFTVRGVARRAHRHLGTERDDLGTTTVGDKRFDTCDRIVYIDRIDAAT